MKNEELTELNGKPVGDVNEDTGRFIYNKAVFTPEEAYECYTRHKDIIKASRELGTCTQRLTKVLNDNYPGLVGSFRTQYRDPEEVMRLYDELKSTHKVAAELHTSHLNIAKILRDNGYKILECGRRRDMPEEEIQAAIDDYTGASGAKGSRKDNGGMTMVDVAKKYDVRIKKLRAIFKERGIEGNTWLGHKKKEKPVRVVKPKPVYQYKVCPYCGWKTKDIEGKGKCYQKHLVHDHKVDIFEHLEKYPEDYELVKWEVDRRKNKVQCAICGQWRHLIDDRHLQKHGINKAEYVIKYPDAVLISDKTADKLRETVVANRKNGIWTNTTSSSYEVDICRFLNMHNVKHEHGNWDILHGREIDIVVGNICIEVNGNYFHSDVWRNKTKDYHIGKTKKCLEKGYYLMHIFDDEILYHKDVVYDRIARKLNISDCFSYVDASQCNVKEITVEELKEFIASNDVEGYRIAKVRYGCFHDAELIGVMTFNQRTSSEYEIASFIEKIGIKCDGMENLLFQHFMDKHRSIRRFVSSLDVRWNPDKDNNFLSKIGFEFEEWDYPAFRYYNPHVDSFKRWYPSSFNKKTILETNDFDKSLSLDEIMKKLGYSKIWDCGRYKFKYIKKKTLGNKS